MLDLVQASIFEGTKKLKITKPIRLIELFGGIGAQAKALENLGVEFEHYRICEFDKYAVASYNAVHGTNFTPSDITKIKGEELGIVDTDKYEYIMTYSFPCTDLSSVGKMKGLKKGSNTKSSLLWEVERLLKETNKLPQILIMENVPNLLSKKNKNDFYIWVNMLESLGYTSKYSTLNAKDFGIPQNRNRVFMLSWLEKGYYYNFPNKQTLNTTMKDFFETHIDKKYILSEKLVEYFKKHEKESIKKGNSFYFKPTNGIGIARTITTRTGNCIYDNFIYYNTSDGIRIRKLTPKECWRLMGFDDESFYRAEKVVSNSQLYKQAGNSIVVNVLMAIFKQLL